MSEAGEKLPADDALVAAPLHHELVFENEKVRVLRTRLEKGETTPVHSHCWPASLYILSWSDIVQRDADGIVTLDSRSMEDRPVPGVALWTPSIPPHTLTNVGERELLIIATEFKQA